MVRAIGNVKSDPAGIFFPKVRGTASQKKVSMALAIMKQFCRVCCEDKSRGRRYYSTCDEVVKIRLTPSGNVETLMGYLNH